MKPFLKGAKPTAAPPEQAPQTTMSTPAPIIRPVESGSNDRERLASIKAEIEWMKARAIELHGPILAGDLEAQLEAARFYVIMEAAAPRIAELEPLAAAEQERAEQYARQLASNHQDETARMATWPAHIRAKVPDPDQMPDLYERREAIRVLWPEVRAYELKQQRAALAAQLERERADLETRRQVIAAQDAELLEKQKTLETATT